MRSITISIATVLLTGSLLGLLTASRAFSDEPPTQSTQSGGEADTSGTQEPTSPAMEFTIAEELAQPAEAGDIQERGLLPGRVTVDQL
jgi:hypothetical protein